MKNTYSFKKNRRREEGIEPITTTLILGGVALAVLAGILASGVLSDVAVGVIQGVIYVITFLVKLILSIIHYFIIFSFYIFKIFFQLNLQIRNNAFIEFGWAIVRDFANLMFIILLIIIALATILRIKEWNAKQLLAKIIITIIIINFSLEIGFLLIDFSNLLAGFFLKEANIENVEDSLGSLLNPQKFINPYQSYESSTDKNYIPSKDNDKNKIEIALTSFSYVIILSIFAIVFSLAIVFILMVYAILMLIRYVILSILLIILPGALMFKFIPQFKNQTDEWYQKFLSWNFFAPIAIFFLYLSIKSVEFLNIDFESSLKETFGNEVSDNSTFTFQLIQIFKEGANLFLVVGLLIGGLIISQKLGITFANTALNFAKAQGNALTKKATGKAKELGKRAITKPLATETMQQFGQKLQQLGKNRGFVLRNLSSPLRKIGGAIGAAKSYREELVNKQQEKLKNVSLEDQSLMFNRVDTPTQIQILKNVSDKGRELVKKQNDKNKEIAQTQAKIQSLKSQEQNLTNALRSPTLSEKDRIDLTIKLNEVTTQIQAEENTLKGLNEDRKKIRDERKTFNRTVLSNLPDYIKKSLVKSSFNMNQLGEKLEEEINKRKKSSFTEKIKKRPLTKDTLNSYMNTKKHG